MVKQATAAELQQIISIIERHANGVGLDALFKELSFQSLAISQRTLNRKMPALESVIHRLTSKGCSVTFCYK
jgi:hypothetical protein